MANRTRRTPEKDVKFLESLSQGASVDTNGDFDDL
jgi:hypothetical protein